MNEKLYRLMNWPEIEAIIYSEEDDPHRLLGPHREGNATVVQAFYPGAVSMELKLPGQKTVEMEQADEAGYYAALVGGKEIESYTLKASLEDGTTEEFEDPYRFAPVITKEDTARFAAGIHYEAYRILGAHMMTIDKTKGVHFAVWAPNALRVSVVGDFNHWDGRRHQMRRLWDSGIFEIFIPGVREGENYKFELKLKGGLTYLKADPYAFGQQLRPDTASVVRNIDGFAWEDEAWILAREKSCPEKEPMSVYEMYLGSFAKPEDGRRYYNYREFAPKVISYVKEMGYTAVELLPVTEHPLDDSWGYQCTGYFAPTSRFGTPEDFMWFVNHLHENNIPVILDWVPAHFCKDEQGLYEFDGTCCYEYADPRKREHAGWGTRVFDYGRPEVVSFLLSSARFWLEMYHIDGIRVDAVASMLYLDYGRQDGQWTPNIHGGRENLEAVEFLRKLNTMAFEVDPNVLMIAEESTAWPLVTKPADVGGLGFNLKWNMGWMNDMCHYLKLDPWFRQDHHRDLTFSMMYAFSENYVLPISHDEVVHMKGSVVGKMPGDYENQLRCTRGFYAYLLAHPGKKLLFMGPEIGQWHEWDSNGQLDWYLLEHAENQQLHAFFKAANAFYKAESALWDIDFDWQGFEWLVPDDNHNNVVVFLRRDQAGNELLCAVNFSPNDYENYRVGVPPRKRYVPAFTTDAPEFGGSGFADTKPLTVKDTPSHGKEQSVALRLPAFGAVFLRGEGSFTKRGSATKVKKVKNRKRS